MTPKEIEYGGKLYAQLKAVFSTRCPNHIDGGELERPENANAFFAALQKVCSVLREDIKSTRV